uniref:MGS-like domain-containing protein n=1 Tax=Populus alba TaxID=43335 RepID=A0A4U5M4C0_POPAL|nr:hypothetical protein D5086_0000323450 [Populus alba]
MLQLKKRFFHFLKFPGCDVLLGLEIRSATEVMVFLSLNDLTKSHRERLAKAFLGLRFRIVSTSGTAHFLELKGISVDRVLKMHEGQPHAGDLANGHIQLMVITSSGDSLDQIDGQQLRMALDYRVPIITTVSGALATSTAIEKLKSCTIEVRALQDFFNVDVDNSKNCCQHLLLYD